MTNTYYMCLGDDIDRELLADFNIYLEAPNYVLLSNYQTLYDVLTIGFDHKILTFDDIFNENVTGAYPFKLRSYLSLNIDTMSVDVKEAICNTMADAIDSGNLTSLRNSDDIICRRLRNTNTINDKLYRSLVSNPIGIEVFDNIDNVAGKYRDSFIQLIHSSPENAHMYAVGVKKNATVPKSILDIVIKDKKLWYDYATRRKVQNVEADTMWIATKKLAKVTVHKYINISKIRNAILEESLYRYNDTTLYRAYLRTRIGVSKKVIRDEDVPLFFAMNTGRQIPSELESILLNKATVSVVGFYKNRFHV